jgi:hypothetical protein
MTERPAPDNGVAMQEIARERRKQLRTLGVIPNQREKIEGEIISPALVNITSLFSQMVTETGVLGIEYGSWVQLVDGELKLGNLIVGKENSLKMVDTNDSPSGNVVGGIHYHPNHGAVEFSLKDLFIFAVPVEISNTQFSIVIGADNQAQLAIKFGSESGAGMIFPYLMRELRFDAIKEVQKQIPFKHVSLDRIPFVEMYANITGKTDYMGKPKDGTSSETRDRLIEEAFSRQFLNHFGILIYEGEIGFPKFTRKK